MAFYHLSQNNSGGGFDFDEAAGITRNVVIEADSAEEATERAEGIGCYWNGVAKGEDCPCCGDRWCEPSGYDRREFPHIYGTHLGTATRDLGRMKDGRETAVHYKDGRVEWYNADNTRVQNDRRHQQVKGIEMSDYMKEAERLISAHEWAIRQHDRGAEWDDVPEKTLAAPAGVPMPGPVAYGFGNTAITGHTNRLMMVRIDIPGGDQYAGAFWLPLVLADEAHTYGVACRAAGEAAGYARAANWLRAKAEKHAEENGYHEHDTGSFVFASREAEEWNNSVLELADEMEAAMRREVK